MKILLISTPRSASTVLRCAIDGDSAIHGELFLDYSLDPASVLIKQDYKKAFELLAASELKPSNSPGEISRKISGYKPDIVGFKLMSIQFIRHFNVCRQLLQDADVVVILKPGEFFRQVRSLARIKSGAYAHDYINKGSRQTNYGVIDFLSALLNITLSRVCLFYIEKSLTNMSQKVILGDKNNLEKIQNLVRKVISRA